MSELLFKLSSFRVESSYTAEHLEVGGVPSGLVRVVIEAVAYTEPFPQVGAEQVKAAIVTELTRGGRTGVVERFFDPHRMSRPGAELNEA